MTTPIKTLMFATDLSQGSGHALRFAVRMAQAMDAQIHVLHVLEPVSEDFRLAVRSFMSDPAAQKKALSGRRAAAMALMRERQDEFWTDEGPDAAPLRDRIAKLEIVEGFAAEVILDRARDLPADMIVMGSHEHGISHTFLGQVAKRVLRRSRIPTLIVPHPDEDD